MVHARRRFLLPAVIALFIMLFGASGGLHSTFIAHAQSNDANAGFEALSPVGGPDTKNPPRLYSGDVSHPLIAPHVKRAFVDLVGGAIASTNGYCLDVTTSAGLSPATFGPDGAIPAADLGFSISANDPITPAPPGANTGFIDSAATSASGGSAGPGDVFCAVVRAPVGYRSLTLSWSYTGSATGTIEIDIPVVTVKLAPSAIGNKGRVCTVGWDSTFLTGAASNASNTLPDPLDEVAPADFTVTPAPVGAVTVQRDVNSPNEWCASITGPAGVPSTFAVSFDFDAVYNRNTNLDDQGHTVSLADNEPPDNQLDIPGNFSLAHIGPAGQILTQQVSPQLTIGARETICILSSDAADTLNPADIQIVPISGAPDIPNVVGLSVFHAAAPIALTNGELCFSYTSTTAGEQAVSVDFTDTNSVTPTGPVRRHVDWTNGTESGPLFVQWGHIDSTKISTSGNLDDPGVTFTTLTFPLQFNVATGSFVASDISLIELVAGSHKMNGATVSGALQGAVLRASLSGGCGYFVVPNNSKPTVVTGTSVGGRFAPDASFLNPGDTPGTPTDLHISITNSAGCNAASKIRLSVDVFYPGQAAPALPTEYVDIAFSFIPPAKNPTIAWIGQTVPITYAFSGGSCLSGSVHVVRPQNQRGNFLPGPGVTVLGGGEATGTFNNNCSITVNYQSVDPGEVDVEVFVEDNPYSKVGFPIFYMALNDITLQATDTSVVSTVGDVSATVRGYFVGTNPSGRPAEKTPDGRTLPADRWVLPDDWDTLSGGRGNWGSPTMPSVNVTFQMQNETVVNGFKSGVKTGGAGWMFPVADTAEPEIGRVPDINGVVPKPRTLTVLTDASGNAAINTFGDWNLSYEGCAASPINGNPLCEPGDVVGHTGYTAVADYPEEPGKFPPIASNTAPTEWTWAGYKSVTIVNTDSPSVKYIVAHLRDRDGYCDAAAFNNVLGESVRFEVDAGGGVILEAQGQPSTISTNRRFATATTFDTVDDLGNPVNVGITQTIVDADECQAWIKVSNSLLEPVNVIVTFPAPPAPIPGDLRITGLVCTGTELVTVTNKGTNPLSLEGFAIRSLPGSLIAQEEHLGLSGFLAPGQSATFRGGPGAGANGWLRTGDTVFGGPGDYARLVWNGFEINRAYCDGHFTTAPTPNPLPLDGEGETVIDVVVPFGQEKQVALTQGWNLVGAGSTPTDIAKALTGHEQDVDAIYAFDPATGGWKRYFTSGPSFLNSMTTLDAGQAYWVAVKRPFTLTVMK
jgi:hypothetical protein